MNIRKEIIVIRSLLNLTQSELAKELNVAFETINRWENEVNEIENYNIEKVYSYAYKNKIHLNKIYEQLYKQEENETTKILFHAAKQVITLPLDFKHSRFNNDFGPGFYMCENFKQAATYISNLAFHNVYVFKLNLDSLKIKEFNVSREWMFSVAYYRGWIREFKEHKIIKEIVKSVEESDIIVAPIADNKMFDIISEFVRGEITDLQCEHCLASTNLGMQYVARSNKALNNIKLLNLCYISDIEKNEFAKERLDLNKIAHDKVKVARIEYKGKGYYIDELLK